eukprot:CAMPEP_0180275754 /NCGR_PEP_ID=MMETSP0988-20121125/6007_1 /TAXON_ID=697907 /ORGANISM="non described non described, Strain CCMP2293" /LENGTH=294 /DNA_ID=CAMNT_0022247033 /DNA_START=82 /DNA_END=964 /DNA_ORIENTATION=+
MTRWDAALLALLMLRHLCSASQPACEGEGEGECQRNLYDQVYTGDMYSERIVVGTREVGLMTNVLLCPALWGDREASEPLSVLDAGAGRGIMVDWLRQGRAPRAVEGVGIELSGVAVDSSPWPELKRNGTLVQGSLDAIPWPDRHFDLVWSHEVLEHIPAAQMPTVAARGARPGGADHLAAALFLGRPRTPAPAHHVPPAAWWDAVWADAGCFPDLDFLGELWRGVPRGYAYAWRPFEEPWVFAYSCGHGQEVARASLASMRHRTAHGQREGAHGWGAFYFGTHAYSHWTQDCG